MSSDINKWCPNGCGKCVFYYRDYKAYHCPRCKHNFTKKEIDIVKEG
jgi:predicted Zn-ribbon and HTH transcriptional regulator